uniref:Uncharacterized protein n=1 Tax=Anguilla anguilla TaxID=7936 RepID=A0A0E9U8L0_ANGAN
MKRVCVSTAFQTNVVVLKSL